MHDAGARHDVIVDDEHAQRFGRRARRSASIAARHRDPRAHARAPAGRGVELERAAEQPGALGHAVAQAVAAPSCSTAARSKPSPSSCTSSGHARVAVDDADADRRAPACVPQRVRQRLLRDAEQRVGQFGGSAMRRARGHEPGVDDAGAVRPRQLELQRLLERSPLERRGREAEHAPPGLLERRLRGRARLAERVGRVLDVGPDASAPSADRSCSRIDTSPCATASCTSRAIRLRSAATASARAFASAASCSRAFVIAIAACFAKSSSRSASVGDERARRVAGEDDAGPDDRAAPPDRDADHALQRRAILRADVAAGDLRVVVEDDRTRARATIAPVTPSFSGKTMPDWQAMPMSASLR